MATLKSVQEKEHIFVATNGWTPRTLPRPPAVEEESAHLMIAFKEVHLTHLLLHHLLTHQLLHQSQRIAGKCAKERKLR